MILTGSCSKERELTIIFGGDVMLDRGIRKQIERSDLHSVMGDLPDVFRNADFTFVNLECAVTDINAPIVKKFSFRGTPALLKDLHESGVTHCILANNHSYDHGRPGLVSTAENLITNKITPVGYGPTQQDACAPVVIEKNGVRAAVFSSVILPLEAWMYLEASPGMCQASVKELCNKISAYRKTNPDTHVIVTLHWGIEYHRVPTTLQRQEAAELVKAGAEAIIGHHPHVVQSYETIDGTPVLYSAGNLIFDNPDPRTHEGVLVKLRIGERVQVTLLPYYTINNIPHMAHGDARQEILNRMSQRSEQLPIE